MVRKTKEINQIEEANKTKKVPRKNTKRQPKITELTSTQIEESLQLTNDEKNPLDELVEKTLEANQELMSSEQNVSSVDQEVGSSFIYRLFN